MRVPFTAVCCLALSSVHLAAYAKDDVDTVKPTEPKVLELQDIEVQSVSELGKKTFDRQQLSEMPITNGDITSALKRHPNVQFDNKNQSGKNPGEIDPANISINGARFWQNRFNVDGMNMNNDLDPGNTDNAANSLGSRSQGFALDVDLLDDITVYDSNVPASFGGFNGGVVDVSTRQPRSGLHGRVSVQTTRSSWTRYHLNPDDPSLDDFLAGFGTGNQPEFTKITQRYDLEGSVTDNWRLLGSFSRKHSEIPTRVFGRTHTSPQANRKETQTRQIDNYFVKSFWQINPNWDTDISFTHAPEEHYLFGPNALNSGYVTRNGGDAVNWQLRWEAPWAKVEQRISWSKMTNRRKSEEDFMAIWYRSDEKDWSTSVFATEGGFGAVQRTQDTLAYQLQADWNSFSTGALVHSWQTGLEITSQESQYQQLNTFNSYQFAGTNQSCNGAQWCSDSPITIGKNTFNGQFANRLAQTDKGNIGFTNHELALYVQNQMHYQRLMVRPGLRLDRNSFMQKTTLAPRLAVELDVFGDQQTRLIAGLNRYYGRNLAAYKLNADIASMTVNYTRKDPSSPWVESKRNPNDAKFSQLDMPYDDERVLGLVQIAADTEFAVKYVNRRSRQPISRAWGQFLGEPSTDTSELAANYYTYFNGKGGESDIYTFTITPLKTFKFLGTDSSGQVALDWSEVNNSGLSNYTSSLNMFYVDNPFIQYDGKIIRYSDKPAENYNRPWTARLMTSTVMPAANLTWSNFFRYRAGYDRIAQTSQRIEHNNELIYVWSKQSYDPSLTWDTRLAWELPLRNADEAVFVNLDITNLLDRQIVDNSTDSGIPTYEVGRQFMLEAGYRF